MPLPRRQAHRPSQSANGTRARSPRRRSHRDARSPRGSGAAVPRILAGGVVVYVLCLGAFALLHYDAGHPRPDAGRVVREFHAYLGFGATSAKAESEPEVMPPIATPPPAPAIVVREPSVLDGVYRTLKAVEREAPGLVELRRGPTFDAARIDLLSRLSEARDVLGAYLDEHPEHDRANGLWDDLQYLQAALRKY